jgi:hypothetical protein
MDFHGYFARNPEREFRCLIIDEADSTGQIIKVVVLDYLHLFLLMII